MENKFIVVTTLYNNKKWIRKCIQSVLNQSYKNFRFIIVDDYSNDGSREILCDYNDPKIKILLKNYHTGSSLSNIVAGICASGATDRDIIVSLDGDDWLAHDDVLSKLNEVYQDENIWLTYGQYKPASGAYENYCKPVDNIKEYRQKGYWVTSHPKTFKKKLFDKIVLNNLIDEEGEFYKYVSDAALMYPMLEMCGSDKHYKFIPDILYVYNDLNSENDMKVHSNAQIDAANKLRELNSYYPLENL
jgi:glycosyltransferase involved in cell wall biosynthesis